LKIGIIIQARYGSTRLPLKMVKKFHNNMGILDILIKRLLKAKLNIPIILATTNNLLDINIVEIAKKNGIDYFRGEENNVLNRFIIASKLNNINKIIRICADNPFLDIEYLKIMLLKFKDSNVDYWSYQLPNNKLTILSHFGFWAEGVKLSALEKIAKNTNELKYIEHVTSYIYLNKSLFNIHFEKLDEFNFQEGIRLTIDTKSDFIIAKEIFNKINKKKIKLNIHNIMSIINENITWKSQMKKNIILNEK
jgi:spore coat polysaccharide biosynthesis protein SpsF